ANKIGAKMSMVLGEDELATNKADVKDMQTGEVKSVDLENELRTHLCDAMLARQAELIAGSLGDNSFADLFGCNG
ncbi:MAG: hypothetical protein RR497_00035, partial [Oscillospiraceae bacterium]